MKSGAWPSTTPPDEEHADTPPAEPDAELVAEVARLTALVADTQHRLEVLLTACRAAGLDAFSRVAPTVTSNWARLAPL